MRWQVATAGASELVRGDVIRMLLGDIVPALCKGKPSRIVASVT